MKYNNADYYDKKDDVESCNAESIEDEKSHQGDEEVLYLDDIFEQQV